MDIAAPTSLGPGRLVVDEAAEPRVVLWLGHGAGGGIDARDLAALATTLPAHGVTVVRHEQPWKVAGKKVASRPAVLDAAWLETAALVAELAGGLPLIVGGRSAGARVACRTAASVGAAAVVCLAFPLHPPGRPEKSRAEELLLPDVPVLVLQGDRDTFGAAIDIVAAVGEVGGGRMQVVAIPGADHGMKVLASSALGSGGVDALVAASVVEFVDGVLAGR